MTTAAPSPSTLDQNSLIIKSLIRDADKITEAAQPLTEPVVEPVVVTVYVSILR